MDWVRGLEGVEDGRLLAELSRLVGVSNRVTAEVLAHVAEVDARGLFRDEACSSMFEYCVRRLGLSESAAYRRIHVARAARRLPVLFEWVAAGRVHLSGLSLLVPHLDADNCDVVLRRAEGKSKRELEELVAELAPRPDVPARVRKLPRRASRSLTAMAGAAAGSAGSVAAPEGGTSEMVLGGAAVSPGSVAAPEGGASEMVLGGAAVSPGSVAASGGGTSEMVGAAAGSPGAVAASGGGTSEMVGAAAGASGSVAASGAGTSELVFAAASPEVESLPTAVAAPGQRVASVGRASVMALAPERYAVQFTADKGLRDKLETARELLRHQNPTGDLAVVVERALDVLVEQLLNRRFGKTARPRKAAAAPSAGSRHVPRSVRRRVFERDEGRCTFVDELGRRCEARGFLELHHRHAFALGGEATVDNISLLCRAHNALVAERELGSERVERCRRGERPG